MTTEIPKLKSITPEEAEKKKELAVKYQAAYSLFTVAREQVNAATREMRKQERVIQKLSQELFELTQGRLL